MSSGECQTRNVNQDEDDKSEAPPPLDSEDIALLKSYGLGPYSVSIKDIEEEIKLIDDIEPPPRRYTFRERMNFNAEGEEFRRRFRISRETSTSAL